MMSRSRKLLLLFLVLSLTVGCDQAAKAVARNTLEGIPPIELLGGFFVFEYTENHGVMLGLGANLPGEVRLGAFVILVGLALLAGLWFVWHSRELDGLGLLGSALLLGGGVGNLIDRILNAGAVVDFMHFGIGWLRTGVFNLADAAIMVGGGLLLLWTFKQGEAEPGPPARG